MPEYKTLTKVFLAEYVDTFRREKGLTQEAMAESLRITCRAYGDLERGKYCFSTIALLFLLLLLSAQEQDELLCGFRTRVAVYEAHAVA